MSSYNATDGKTFRSKTGALSAKLASEFSSIDSAIDTAKIQLWDITAGLGTNTALATSGVDLASGSDATYYGVFFAPVDITAVSLEYLMDEAYVKDTSDAKIEIKDNAETPNTIFTSTLTATGVDADTKVSVSPSTGKASIAAGTRLDLVITATGSSSGTGHAKIILKYMID